MKKANNVDQLMNSIKNGRFTLDGSDIIADSMTSSELWNLQSLEGCPQHFLSDVLISKQPRLTSLKGGPTIVKRDYFCVHCGINTVDGFPIEVGDDFIVSSNKLTSLHNIHKFGKSYRGFQVSNNPIVECILGLILIDITYLSIRLPELRKKYTLYDNTVSVEQIMIKYVGKGKTALYKAAQELINVGYPDLAKL